MKKQRIAVLFLVLVVISLCAGCAAGNSPSGSPGSFTDQPVISSDGQYRAEHGAKQIDGYDAAMIQVDVYDHPSNQLIASFAPARASDFWGVCREPDIHRIWMQSADVGILCYTLQDG